MNIKKNMPTGGPRTQNKALTIYNDLKGKAGGDKGDESAGDEEEAQDSHGFTASSGWFERFTKRFNLHNLKIMGESASADHFHQLHLQVHQQLSGMLPTTPATSARPLHSTKHVMEDYMVLAPQMQEHNIIDVRDMWVAPGRSIG